MAESNESSESKPTSAQYAEIATAMADAAKSMPSALDFDKARGLAEEAAADVANKMIEDTIEELDDYLKEEKPEIVEDMKKCCKKGGGACGGKQQKENKKKGGSCGGVASSACASSCAATPGFQPSQAVALRAQFEAAKAVAEQTLEAVAGTIAATMGTLGSCPSTITTAEGSPAGPTIVIDSQTLSELIAALGEISGALTSLIMTQDALIGRTGLGL